MNRTWITYGVTGIVGVGLIAGGATAAAASMELRTTAGEVVSGGAITGKDGSVLDRPTVHLQVTGSSATVVSANTPTALTSTVTIVSAASAPAPAPPAPAPAPAPVSAPTAASAISAASAGSVASANSN